MNYKVSRNSISPFMITQDNVLIEVNEGLVNLTGYIKEELTGKSINDFIELFRINSCYNFEKTDNCEMSCYIFTKECEPREVTIICKNINERKKYIIKEKLFSRIDNRLPYVNKLIDDNNIGTALYSVPEGIVLKTNKVFSKYWGRCSLEGKSIKEIYYGYEGSKYEKLFLDIIETGKTYHSQESTNIYDKECSNYWDATLVPIVLNNKVKYIIHTAIDVSEKVFSRNIIFKQEQEFKSILENLEIHFAILSYPELKIIDINNKAMTLLNSIIGYQSNIIGKSIYDLFNNKISEIDNIKKYFVNNRNCFTMTGLIKVNEEEIYLKHIFQPKFNSSNEIYEILGISFDISDEEKTKNVMKHSLIIQDDIYANITHELRTPVNVMYSATQMIELYLKNDNLEDYRSKLNNYNDNIKQNCYRMIKLTNNLLDLSRIKNNVMVINLIDENIVDIIRNIVLSVSIYIKFKKINIEFETNVKEKIIACDSNFIDRILLNLISNAVKFSNPGSSIVVSVLAFESVVEITVKDNGIGMEKKQLDKIFERFYQVDTSLSRNAEGVGIGLFLVKSLVELHGGKISIESEVGHGSTFKIELPVKSAISSTRKSTSHFTNKTDIINVEFSDIYLND